MAKGNSDDATTRRERMLAAAVEAQSRQLERQGRYEASLLSMREQDAATVTQVRTQFE